jgi:hypothetical protein
MLLLRTDTWERRARGRYKKPSKGKKKSDGVVESGGGKQVGGDKQMAGGKRDADPMILDEDEEKISKRAKLNQGLETNQINEAGLAFQPGRSQ